MTIIILTAFLSDEDKTVKSLYQQNYYGKLHHVVQSNYENINDQMFTSYVFHDEDTQFVNLMLLECNKQEKFHMDKIKIINL